MMPLLSKNEFATLPSKSPWEVATMRHIGGVYRGRVYFPWNGKRLWIARDRNGYHISCQEHAEAVLYEIRVEHFKETFDPAEWGKDKTIFVPNAWAVYIDQHTGRESTKHELQFRYGKFIESYFGKMTLKEIEEHHVWDWFSKLPDELKPSYKNTILATLKAFFQWHRITRQKAFKYPTQSVPREEKKSLTSDEQARVLEAILPRHRPIYRFLMSYGCRVSEAVNLRKTDIDRQKKTITIKERKNGKDLILPLDESLVGGGVVDTGVGKTAHPFDSGHLTNLFYQFTNAKGQPYNRMVLDNMWKEASMKAGVRVVPPEEWYAP